MAKPDPDIGGGATGNVESEPWASQNVVAIAAMIASQAIFTVNDALMKLAAREVPGGEAIFIRGVASIVLAGALAWWLGDFRKVPALLRQWRLIALRNVGEVLATLFYLTALFHMPIADATAILQVVPLAITAGAALVLGERVGWRRWLATAFGFVGVLIVIRPGTGCTRIVFAVWRTWRWGVWEVPSIVGFCMRGCRTVRRMCGFRWCGGPLSF